MISIIIPTYQSPNLLNRAIDSLLNQTSDDWQAIICLDDGLDYTWIAKRDPRITVVNSEQVKSGPGLARNRGLEYVKGNAIAYLDDDDELSNRYVELSIEALKTRPAAVFPTRYLDSSGQTIRTIGKTLSKLDINNFSQCLGSIHVVAECKYVPAWRDCFAEDVLHTCEVINQLGGCIDVVQGAEYISIVNPVSICSTISTVDQEYEQLINNERNTDIKSLFEYRKKINLMYESMPVKTDYHTFISSWGSDWRERI